MNFPPPFAGITIKYSFTNYNDFVRAFLALLQDGHAHNVAVEVGSHTLFMSERAADCLRKRELI